MPLARNWRSLDESPSRRGVHRDGRKCSKGRKLPPTFSTDPASRWRGQSFAGDFQLAPAAAPAGTPVRVHEQAVTVQFGPYVLADGGGERFGGKHVLARNANTTDSFSSSSRKVGRVADVGAHFHARHFENFFALD
jgi:hypothetical protein